MAITGPRPGDRDDLGWNDGVKIKHRPPTWNGELLVEAVYKEWSYGVRCEACGWTDRIYSDRLLPMFGRWPFASMAELWARAKCPACGALGVRGSAMGGHSNTPTPDEQKLSGWEVSAQRLRIRAAAYGWAPEIAEAWIDDIERWKAEMGIDLIRWQRQAWWAAREESRKGG